MKSETPLDYAVFQLSPNRSRCELFVSRDGNTEKLASGLFKPFVTHLKVAEDQVALLVQSIKLEVERCKNSESWFTKGTFERFVRFVSTPEIMELVNSFGAETSQLEAARRIYSEGGGDQPSSTLGGSGTRITAVDADATKKELLRAIDVRLVSVRQDLTMAYARAAAAGFNLETVSELQMFADRFGAHRLKEACSKFLSLCDRWPNMINPWKAKAEDQAVRSSYGSDMSIDEDPTTPEQYHTGSHQHLHDNEHLTGREPDATNQLHLEQSEPSTCQRPKTSSLTFPLRLSRESSIEKDDSNRENGRSVEKEKKEEGLDRAESSQTQTAQTVRRLSVQDRINLFENKQKETSGSGSKPVVGKSAELRRLSSDVSSAATVEKSVLRRWSGASDMSIDFCGEKKDIESPLCTPSSASVSHTKSEDQKGLNDKETSAKHEFISVSGRVNDAGLKDQSHSQTQVGVTSGIEEVVATKVGTSSAIQLTVSSGLSEDASHCNELTSALEPVANYDVNDQPHGKTKTRSFLGRVEDNGLKNQTAYLAQFRYLPGGRAEQLRLFNQGNVKGSLGVDEHFDIKDQDVSGVQTVSLKDRAALQTQSVAFASRVGDNRSTSESSQPLHVGFPNHVELGLKDQSVSQPRFKASLKMAVESGQLEGGSGLKNQEAFTALHKATVDDPLPSQPRWRSLGEIEEVGKKDATSSGKQYNSSVTKGDGSGLQKMKFQELGSVSEQVKRSQHHRTDRSSSIYGSSGTLPSGKMVSDGQEGFGSILTPPAEPIQRVRQSKGNQELNDELQMKANELEKLFAEHKLRVPGDQSNTARRSSPANLQPEPAPGLPYGKPIAEIAPAQLSTKNMLSETAESSSNVAKYNARSPMTKMDNKDYSDTPNQSFYELCFSDDSRGKFYDSYMLKRDAKLREEWSAKRAEKEAKLKAMHDSLERSRAEMEAKFSGSADRQQLISSACHRAERLRSFNTRSTIKREQLPLEFVQSEDDEALPEFAEQKPFGQDRSFSETSLGDIASKSILGKKLLPNKSPSSSILRTSAAPVPRSAVRASPNSGRQRTKSENSLAQSVPNFSDLRKENTKPSSAVSKTRSQLRNYAHSKITIEEIPLVNEEKPRRSQALRKSSASPTEFRDMSPLNSKDLVSAPLKFDREEPKQTLHDKFSKNLKSMPVLRKGNSLGPGAVSVISKLKASMTSDAIHYDDEFDVLAFEHENSVDVVKYGEEEFGTVETEDQTNLDSREPRLSQESDKLVNSGSEDGDALKTFSQLDPSLVAELPTAVPSTFHPSGSLQNSRGESPISWNSRIRHPFAYPHETSDIDASMDSPMGSPGSWNSHPLINQTEADVARMRKKWGSAQKPVLVANSSHNQSRKDVTKGFKRLLKFGRKSRGTESLVDWISATTSEGDDDTEDGREPASRSSEDLRKSRMGFSQGHPSDDSFNDSEFFSEQVQALNSYIPAPPANFKLREDHLSGSSIKAPRSFFSLSTFRSKGSDSKPR